ncbi:ATP-dependent helicase BRM [Coccomyxa sp. Obi]|nr:ATP-dependent helicase BRM [Coccomyxa sp. Obi]
MQNGGSAAAPVPAQGSDTQQSANIFTAEQLHVLRNQILAFRLVKNRKELPPHLLRDIKPVPLQHAHQSAASLQPPPLPTSSSVAWPGQSAPALPKSEPASAPTVVVQLANSAPSPSSGPSPSLAQTPQASAAPQPPPLPELHRQLGPLFTFASGSRAPQYPGAQGLQQQQQQQQNTFNFEGAALLALEYRSLVEKTRQRQMAELQAALANGTSGWKMANGRAALMLRLKRLRAMDAQARLRAAVEREQQDIMNMPDRSYRKFARQCWRQRMESARAEEKGRADKAAERIRAIKVWRGEAAERASSAREMRVARNRYVMRAHERLLRDMNRLKEDDRTRRMEALKANDFEAYQQILRETAGPGTSGERYEVISRFLSTTEEYLHKLASKVAHVKLAQEASEAAALAVSRARAQGLSDEEVAEAAKAAEAEAAATSSLVQSSKADASDAQSRYYNLAHSVEEMVRDQPSLLKPPAGAKLREYQMVGLQWMVSLYNNHLNGILADEMGLGKTVQVMALVAYLMEHKNNYGPHLIIVPNAVMVNWKSELTQWLPSVRCVYYVGHKDERARKFATEVASLQFNVLVTTYEYIMRDRAKLSKVDWKYIIIDEAQRMKDRQSKLAKDLDRFTAARRLLLTGTPLQNDLSELWSLLNLLLPQVFDDKATFAEWFSDALGKQGAGGGGGPDEWLETEKRVVVIHRLHQILEPFMLRRQVQDVEGKLPPKVPVVVKVPMAPFQSILYNWVKASGTLRLDPEGPMPGSTIRTYASLNNKCMELRKVCNHPCLSYPPPYHYDAAMLVRRCGKFEVLDRMLVKFHATGHRVLLFSTMTKLLDLLESYLSWRRWGPDQRRMEYLRIDGSTSLEDREKAIQRFNAKESSVFIFLLSIRAAGRGLNLQSADTVVIYDPDPNPKNEEQAIARSHRIGQTKEVRVIHLEAVADPELPTQHPSENGQVERRAGYADSIESLVRNNIQKMKIDMANEVIDAGRFDMNTTMDERRHTLEEMLQDEERLKKAVNAVPSRQELNAQLARSEAERVEFDRLDCELSWPAEEDEDEIPSWLHYSEADLAEAIAATSKQRPNQAKELAAMAGILPKAAVASPEVPRGRPQRARSAANMSTESGLNSFGITDSGEEAAGGDEADMEEEVVGKNIVEVEAVPSTSGRTGSMRSASPLDDAWVPPGHKRPHSRGATPSAGPQQSSLGPSNTPSSHHPPKVKRTGSTLGLSSEQHGQMQPPPKKKKKGDKPHLTIKFKGLSQKPT